MLALNIQDQLNQFSELMEEIENQSKRRIVSKKEINELSIYIGGFKYWKFLNEDCKIEVLKYLDYCSRCQLSICSKSDHKLVSITPLYVYEIEISDNERSLHSTSTKDFENIVVRVKFSQFSGYRFEVVFWQVEEDVHIRWFKYFGFKQKSVRSLIWKSCNYYEQSVKFAEKWMKVCNYEFQSINVDMNKYPMKSSTVRSLARCKTIRINATDIATYSWWLEKCPEKLDYLELKTLYSNKDTFTIPTDFLDFSQIKNAGTFYFWCRSAFTDEQFLNLKAKKFGFHCVNITANGINDFIKKWVNGHGVNEFQKALLWSAKLNNSFMIMRGIEFRSWDQTFREQEAEFCSAFNEEFLDGEKIQVYSRIDPYESITIYFSPDTISIIATGHRMTRNKKTFTRYQVP